HHGSHPRPRLRRAVDPARGRRPPLLPGLPGPVGPVPLMLPRLTARQWVGYAGFALVLILTAAVVVWRGDILRSALDPQVPFQTYQPPAMPDYAQADAWALLDSRTPTARPAHVFFVHSTTYNGGKEWNGAIDDARAVAGLRGAVLPDYAGPLAPDGDVDAPLYRPPTLYNRPP